LAIIFGLGSEMILLIFGSFARAAVLLAGAHHRNGVRRHGPAGVRLRFPVQRLNPKPFGIDVISTGNSGRFS